jgi:hypothetical protein
LAEKKKVKTVLLLPISTRSNAIVSGKESIDHPRIAAGGRNRRRGDRRPRSRWSQVQPECEY